MTMAFNLTMADYPFKVGEAVYVCGKYTLSRPPELLPGVITKIGKRVSVLFADGRQRTLKGEKLVYQGYCAACEVPAIQHPTGLCCPLCGEDATPTPPPPPLIYRWFPIQWTLYAEIAYHGAVLGCTWKEAHTAMRAYKHERFTAMCEQVGIAREQTWQLNYHQKDALTQLAILGDAERFTAEYQRASRHPFLQFLDLLLEQVDAEENLPAPRRRIEMPALPNVQIDTEPDTETNDQVSRWLRQQMGGAL